MAKKKLNLIDRAWLLGDRRGRPLYVAGLAVFVLPRDAGDDFVAEMMAGFWAARTFVRPSTSGCTRPGSRR